MNISMKKDIIKFLLIMTIKKVIIKLKNSIYNKISKIDFGLVESDGDAWKK